MKEVKEWMSSRSLNFKIEDNIIHFDNFGKLLFIEGQDDILIGDDYQFVLSDDEYDLLEKDDLNFIAFKWGTKFYYSSLIEKKSEYGDDVYEPEFNDLLNLGIYKSNFQDLGFINLGVHTGYELLNGSGEANKWVEKAEFYNHKAMGICEKNTLAGTLPLQLACKKKGLKCILGETVLVSINFEKEGFSDSFPIKLFVKNEIGWRNLLNISKLINVDYKEERAIPEDIFLKKSEGLIAVFTTDSYFNKIINSKEAKSQIKKYKKSFSKNLFYQIDCTEFDDDDLDYSHLSNLKTYFDRFSDEIRPVLISDSYYIERGDSDVKELLNQMDSKASPYSDEQHFKDIDEIFQKFIPLFDSNPDLFDIVIKGAKNTKIISKLCRYEIETGNHKLPKFEVEDPEKLYDEIILKGFKKKVIEKFGGDEEKMLQYLERIDIENDVIKGAGFIDYFLILWDIIKWAKNEGILVGPARGSAGGSLVAYLLGVTEIDPIEYNLLFERFLNKARVSGERAKSADALPDIDVDFEGERRQEVKNYIEEKYGRNFVCSIGTYTRLKPKSALKDFGRVKGLLFNDVNFATKEIPDSHNPKWGDIFQNASTKERLKKFVQSNIELCEVIKAPLGQPKAGSIHPSAVLIVPKTNSEGEKMEVWDWMPIKEMDGMLISEWEGKYIDAAGFLKEDILGIKQLDKLQMTLKLIKKNRNKRVNLNKIPINKKSVMRYFANGWNEDVFQFGTSGLKTYSKKVIPEGIEDLISMNALFRPGPMDSKAHEDFVEIKHGRKKPEFDYMLKTVTGNTFGLYVYQEQIMQAVHVLGKLTLAEADELRTAIKKFDKEKMSSAKEKFLKGALENGCGEEEAEKIWDKLNAFSAYGFNRSHSAAYSLIGYWCQYLKVKYPLEFWTSSLNFSDEKLDMPNRLSEIEKIDCGIDVKPPNINRSSFDFTSFPDVNSIYWSLTKIKGVGEVAATNILESRKDGEFFDLEDFLNKVPKAKVNKRVVQLLIMSGAFDDIGGENGLEIGEFHERYKILKKHAEFIGSDLPKEIEEGSAVNSNWFWSIKQKELTGFGHINYPSLIKIRNNKLKNFPYITSNDFEKEKLKMGKPWQPEEGGKPYTVAGKIHLLKERKSKNGNWITRIVIESNNSLIFLGAFGEIYDDFKDELRSLDDTKELFCINGFALASTQFKGNIKSNNEIWLNKDSALIRLTKKKK